MFIPMWAIVIFLLLLAGGAFSDTVYVEKKKKWDPYDPDPDYDLEYDYSDSD